MGTPPAAAPGFAPQVMGTPPAAAPSSPGTPFLSMTGQPVAPPAMAGSLGAPAPSYNAAPAEPVSPFAALATSAAAMAPAAPSASGDALVAHAPTDAEIAASPWNKANNPGFNRELLPSAMAIAPEPPPAAKAAAKPEPAVEEPSRAPWIIVGVLVLVAIAGGVTVWKIRAGRGADGQIVVPGGGTGVVDDGPADTAAPSSTASASAAPVHHAAPKPKTYLDDPYSDTPSNPQPVRPKATTTAAPAPAPTPTAAPHRLFGTEN
jgi:hypothetical protein